MRPAVAVAGGAAVYILTGWGRRDVGDVDLFCADVASFQAMHENLSRMDPGPPLSTRQGVEIARQRQRGLSDVGVASVSDSANVACGVKFVANRSSLRLHGCIANQGPPLTGEVTIDLILLRETDDGGVPLVDIEGGAGMGAPAASSAATPALASASLSECPGRGLVRGGALAGSACLHLESRHEARHAHWATPKPRVGHLLCCFVCKLSLQFFARQSLPRRALHLERHDQRLTFSTPVSAV